MNCVRDKQYHDICKKVHWRSDGYTEEYMQNEKTGMSSAASRRSQKTVSVTYMVYNVIYPVMSTREFKLKNENRIVAQR